jgi:hypothetical protein
VALVRLRVLLPLWALSITVLGAAMGAAGQDSPRPGAAQLFVEVTGRSGLDFSHDNGLTGDRLLPEITGAGGALFDYDNDGDLDLYAVQGAALGPGAGASSPPVTDRLFRNDLGPAFPLFTDTTETSGIRAEGYGMGAATGDIDNDGWVDLYVTNLGPNQMFRNNGDGTFSDVTASSGAHDARWSASATFFDYDLDGWLDLFVTNYVDFSTELTRECFSRGSAADYCNPQAYDAVSDRLFRNNGDGTFSDVSLASGIGQVEGRGLGVAALDANGDGWLDLYVANDGGPNHLWINDEGVRFRDEGLLAGVAVNRTGEAEGGMGIGTGDVDADGDQDLFVTNLDNESNTLYINLGDGLFEDRTIDAGLLGPSFGLTGFGTGFLDYDHDGRLDLAIVNGAVRMLEDLVRQGDPYPLKQRNQLFHNAGNGRFVEVTDEAGTAFEPVGVSRGLALGDLDNDGATDLVIFNNRGRARVLLNSVETRNHWLGLRLVDNGRDALHASVELVAPNGGTRWQRAHTDGSYCVANDPRVLFGLGPDDAPGTVRVHWTGGRVEEFPDLAVDRYWELRSGGGTVVLGP